MLSHLDGDAEPALALFARAKQHRPASRGSDHTCPTRGGPMTSTLPTTDIPVLRDDTGLDVVTGAFSYSGAAIAKALIAGGTQRAHGHGPSRARTRSGRHRGPAPGLRRPDRIGRVVARRHDPLQHLLGAFCPPPGGPRPGRGQLADPVPRRQAAGVQRIVHVSITNPRIESPFPYFRGKALVERALAESEVSYAVLRPAILFGGDGVLINNIAWLLRRVAGVCRRGRRELPRPGHPRGRPGPAVPRRPAPVRTTA